MRLKWTLTYLLCVLTTVAIAQPKKEVRNGNKLYKQQNYKGAAESYQQALQKQPNYIPGLFNLGNAQYQQKDFENARKVFEGTSKTAKEKNIQSAANYNIGNTYLEEKKYKEAIEAYKEALRKNPQDQQAKYNLSYALQMLKNQQGGGGDDKNKDDKNQDQNKENKDEQKDKNEDKNEQNKEQEQEDKQDQQNKDEQNKGDKDEQKEEEEKRPQPKPSKLSEQQAEQLLNALQQEEKKLQDKLKKGQAVPIKVDKDW